MLSPSFKTRWIFCLTMINVECFESHFPNCCTIEYCVKNKQSQTKTVFCGLPQREEDVFKRIWGFFCTFCSFNNLLLTSQHRGSLQKLLTSLSFQDLLNRWYFGQVISPTLKARYIGQLSAQNLCPLGGPGGPIITPSTGCSFSLPSMVRMSYGGTILFPGPTRKYLISKYNNSQNSMAFLKFVKGIVSEWNETKAQLVRINNAINWAVAAEQCSDNFKFKFGKYRISGIILSNYWWLNIRDTQNE